ncbi:MAG: aminotransferase class V-fold PLP-dependent enzyme [Thermoanaerobaculaceae bacterium]|jgi:glutamate/tyrosine decarboxylase-like PLP-dependent enzyme|nr:aminotransferase class V-fold PLP-dependent enzyme [Thermoanaerobaculaceae bacterium]
MTLPPLPDHGLSVDEILSALAELRSTDLDYTKATSYHFESGNAGLREVANAAAATAWGRSGLDPTAFPSIAAIENDLVGAALDLHGGGPDAVGTVTSGGTESCMLAVLEARERYRRRGGQGQPTMLLPVTAHPAFRKGAWLFGVEIVDIPVDADFKADAEAMVAAMDERAALAVVSAPSYAHGVIDPVAEVAAAAAERDLLCHLDLCIGGWVLPFIREAEGRPPVDMSIPGVTSASMDLHKYGYAPKGVSILLSATPELREYHFFADAGWPGYPLINNTLLSSRSAAPGAAAWAVLHLLGREGLRDLALKSRAGALHIAEGVAQIPGLRVVAPPESSLVCVGDTGDPQGPDVRIVADEAHRLGWSLQVQPARRGGPTNIHVTVSAGISDRSDELLDVLRAATEAATGKGRADIDPNLAAAAASIDVDALDAATIDGLMQIAGFKGQEGPVALPDEMAGINALLEGSPAPLVEVLLKAVFSEVFTPNR